MFRHAPDSSNHARAAVVDPVLHRAGFVPVHGHPDSFHRLPTGMTDPTEQRQTVTKAIDMLNAEGIRHACPDRLVDFTTPVGADDVLAVGDGLVGLATTIRSAGHTRDVAGALSELTAPGDGVLERLVETLDATADWWAGLDNPTDLPHANRLRYITTRLDSYAREIRALRGELADRHTTHPATALPSSHSADPRVTAARAVSPTAHRAREVDPTAATATPTGSSPRRPSAPRR